MTHSGNENLTIANVTFFSEDRIIVRALFERKKIASLYFLHEKYKLSPAQVVNSMKKLANFGLVDFTGTSANLSPEGRTWVLKNRKRIFEESSEPYWHAPRADLQADRGNSEEEPPYRIRMKKLDKSLLQR